MTGTYIGLNVLPSYSQMLKNYCSFNEIKCPRNFHTTLIYSRLQSPEPVVLSDFTYTVLPLAFDIFGKDDERILVLKLDAPSVVERHMALMGKHNFTYDFDKYQPHITLSYSYFGDIDLLPLPKFPIVLGEEYIEDLDLEWRK